jgi:hypothetical protein
MLTKSNGVSHSVPAGENAFDSHLCYAAPPVHTPDGERLYYMGSNGATTVCFVYFPDDRDEFTKTGLGRNILVGKALKKNTTVYACRPALWLKTSAQRQVRSCETLLPCGDPLSESIMICQDRLGTSMRETQHARVAFRTA